MFRFSVSSSDLQKQTGIPALFPPGMALTCRVFGQVVSLVESPVTSCFLMFGVLILLPILSALPEKHCRTRTL